MIPQIFNRVQQAIGVRAESYLLVKYVLQGFRVQMQVFLLSRVHVVGGHLLVRQVAPAVMQVIRVYIPIYLQVFAMPVITVFLAMLCAGSAPLGTPVI